MYIQPNKLLPPSSRIIRFYQCSLISTEGPNINGKLNLAGIEIPYESQFTSRMILNPGAVNQPVMYGFLGNNITFLALKITYDETNPRCVIEEEQYIEYWYEDDSTVIRQAHKLLILTGNSTKRIPQVYLNNPGEVKVYVDVLAANMAQGDLDLDDIRNDVVEFKDLYYNNIITDTYWNPLLNSSGSTQFQFLDLFDNVVLYLDFEEISTIEKNESKYQLIITTKSYTIIRLFFLSAFEMNQANSRINWVINNAHDRYLSKEHPSIDIESPLIVIDPLIHPVVNPNIYTYPYISGTTITQSDIVNYYISEIYDQRDGSISNDSSITKIRRYGQIETLDNITNEGEYDILISVRDIANNYSVVNLIVLVDINPPIITFKTGITDIFNMNIPYDTRVPAYGITKDDILRKSVDSIYDNVVGNIPVSAITLKLDDNDYTPIFEPGQYTIDYIISDRSGNLSTYTKTLIVDGDIIIYPNMNYILGDAFVETQFIYTGDIGTGANIIISGNTIPIFNSGGTNSGGTLIWNYNTVDDYEFTYEGESLNVIINNTVFRIIFNGWGSLLFSIEPIIELSYFINYELKEEKMLFNDTGITYTDISHIDNNYYLYLDNNSGSTNNISSNNIIFSSDTFINTDIYLESFGDLSGNTYGDLSGETIQNSDIYLYYVNKYTLDTEILENILNGNLPIISLQKVNDNIEIYDLIINDNYKFYIKGDYPKGIYNFRVEIKDNINYTNYFRYSLIIN